MSQGFPTAHNDSVKNLGSSQAPNPSNGRLLVFGDVHGCLAALDALLDVVRPQREDVVVFLGDYIDRGPDSRGVVDRLLELSRQTRLVPLLGNHEEMLLQVCAGEMSVPLWLAWGGSETVQSYGLAIEQVQPDALKSAIPPRHFEFFAHCRDLFETQEHFFVHANYEADRPLKEQSPEYLRWINLRQHIPGPHHSGKVAIVGHTSQKDGEVLDLGYLKCIDTYCYGGQWLTVLDVGSGDIVQADKEGRLRVLA
ncbi:MAG: serine/threonine protein phosphatase [Gemmatales bacterium]|nr:serine/threonine protein phosphatase [Gemmatales bacterium]MDW8387941.1 metallophosphoesterase family protein [Gemmatales bacterium]